MASSSHQTLRLAPGRHRGPDEGVCALELASVLAGERFSDHPRSVCPVIGGFLRVFNDGCDDDVRRALYRLAADAVGTRGDRRVRAARRRLCRERNLTLRGATASGIDRVLLTLSGDLVGGQCAAAFLHAGAAADAIRVFDELVRAGRTGPPTDAVAARASDAAVGCCASPPA